MTSLLHTSSLLRRLLLGVLALLVGLEGIAQVGVQAASVQAAARLNGGGCASLSSPLPSIQGRAHVAQDPAWVKQKLACQIGRSNTSPFTGYPAADLLNLTYVSHMQEPPATGKDAKGIGYTDWYFANFCDAGATDVAMDFWPIPNDRNFGLHQFTDPHNGPNGYPISTWWDDTNYHAYLMYIAEQVKLPGWTVPGEVTFMNYPSANTYPADLRDTMNWEASGHASNWSSYFYLWTAAANLTQAGLLTDVEGDIYYGLNSIGVPPVVNVDTYDLPSWYQSQGHISHAVAIVGYDNTHGTYTYIETCTTTSCGNKGPGVYTISQSALYNGIKSAATFGYKDGGIVW